jgi:hypothetical protein
MSKHEVLLLGTVKGQAEIQLKHTQLKGKLSTVSSNTLSI